MERQEQEEIVVEEKVQLLVAQVMEVEQEELQLEEVVTQQLTQVEVLEVQENLLTLDHQVLLLNM